MRSKTSVKFPGYQRYRDYEDKNDFIIIYSIHFLQEKWNHIKNLKHLNAAAWEIINEKIHFHDATES